MLLGSSAQAIPDPLRIGDRLRQMSRQRFAGRQEELARFRQCLAAPASPVSLLIIHGPGGVGKTALLERMRGEASDAGVPCVKLDTRNFEPTAAGFTSSLANAMGLPHATPLSAVLTAWSEQPRRLLLIDTAEHLQALEGWLREHFLPELPLETLVVLAGRLHPGHVWRTDPLWQDAVCVMALANLSETEAAELMAWRGIEEAHREALMRLSHGHPLALALLTEAMEAEGKVPERLDNDIIRCLTECFAANAPSPLHRQALVLCAAAFATTQDLIAHVIDEAQAPALFDWLASLSFIEAGPRGVFPHDLVRDAIPMEKRWRAPEDYAESGMRMAIYYLGRIRTLCGEAQREAVTDLLFAQRNTAVMQQFFNFSALDATTLDLAKPPDRANIISLVEAEAGPRHAELAAHWLGHPATECWVVRAAGDRVAGAYLWLKLDQLDAGEIERDPGLSSLREWLAARSSVRPGDTVWCGRLAVVEGGIAATNPLATVLMSVNLLMCTSTSHTALTVFTMEAPEHWRPLMTHVDFQWADSADFELDGRCFGHFVHDWRIRPVVQWLRGINDGHFAALDHGSAVDEQKALPPRLSETAFSEAVRDALRKCHNPATLADHPLLGCGFVRAGDAGHAPDLAAALCRLMKEAAQEVVVLARDAKFLRALELTYFQPVGSQELAAEKLGLPFGTYRYQLNIGIERLVQALWRREMAA